MRAARRTYYIQSMFTRCVSNSVQFTRGLPYKQTTSLLAASCAAGVYLNQRRTFSSSFNVYAEEAVAQKKVYQGTPPEVDDTHRYILNGNSLKGIELKDLDITLYQYQVCPFCCKVRAFLDYNKIPYKIVEVNPVLKGELKFSKDYKKVPIIIINGVQLNDSSIIISSLSEIVSKKTTAERPKDEVEWRKWVDHKLVHTLPPNIYRSPKEAMDAFDYISTMNQFNWYQRAVAKYAGSMAMYGVSKKLKKKYGIEDEREAIYTCANEWMENLKGKPFHGGEKPDLADLATYGALSSIEGLLTFNDMLANSNIGEWYWRVKREVGPCSGSKVN